MRFLEGIPGVFGVGTASTASFLDGMFVNFFVELMLFMMLLQFGYSLFAIHRLPTNNKTTKEGVSRAHP